jgi:four helix bundle protein
MKIRSFRDLEVWTLAMELVMECYRITDQYPTEERYGLAKETRRSAISIPSNVAEGHNRHSTRAYLNHVNIALGSHAELATQLEIAIRRNYAGRADLAKVADLATRVGQMLHGLRRSLRLTHAAGHASLVLLLVSFSSWYVF